LTEKVNAPISPDDCFRDDWDFPVVILTLMSQR